jgi:gamma-butyrobetaine dioxygenase
VTARKSPVDLIAELFTSAGAADYLGEPVTVAAHLLQSASLAEAAGAPPALVAAALLHDIGHLPLPAPASSSGPDAVPPTDAVPGGAVGLTGHDLMAGTDNRHGARAAAWLSAWFPPAVTEPIRLHVQAKRYLCAVEPAYFGLLSEASVYTLSVQGGPMTAAEARAFEASPHAEAAIAVRRWDDLAKDPSAEPPDFAHFAPILDRLAVRRTASPPHSG